MPSRLPIACTRPGCRGLVRNGVCSVCGPRRRQADQTHDAERGTAAARGYDSRWQTVRLTFLSAHPLCELCKARGLTVPATDVHHLTPKRVGGQDTEDNLQALCHACHSRVTAAGG